MRSEIKVKYGKPKVGQKRTVIKFAWVPTRIITFVADEVKIEHYYWIWLENYKEDQEYMKYLEPHVHGGCYANYRWTNIKRYQ